MTSPAPIIEVERLRFTYPGARDAFRLAVDELRITPGEHTAIIGPSGCGKTTLLRLLTGVVRPASGTVRVDGRDVATMDEAARRALRVGTIGMVFQHFALLDYLTALENILLPYHISRTLGLDAGVRARARALAESVGIERVLARRPARLSQGERQRVAICRALVTQPRLVVCDEPTGNLDPARSVATIDLIVREAAAAGATVVVVTHDHALLDRFERVVDLEAVPAPDGGAA